MTVLLTNELLAEYDACLRRADLPHVKHLRPGLDPAAIDALTGRLGIRLPYEARMWFGWHDGFEPTGFDLEIAPAFVGLTLAQAIELYRWWLDESDRLAEQFGDGARIWRPEWFPLVRTYGVIACDCSVPEGAPTPIRLIDPPDHEDFHVPRAASLGDMINLWIGAWDSGAWYAEPERRIPQRRRSHPDEQGRRHPLLDV